MKRNLLSLVLLAFGLSYAYGQGSTSSAMNGRVVDENGEPLIGATVIALHQPTGTDYGAVTNIDGYYFFPTIRVGGPYKVTASYIGFETKATDNIVLKLGEKRNINFSLAEAATQLAEIVVSAQTDAVINSGRTGAATNVTSETIDRNPSISRSIDDFVRLTPQAATGVGNGGTSIAGRSGRYNNITIDGAVNNDAFGLNASGQPGTNAGSEIISLDAVQEVSVQVAPYDVTKGSFTGGGINAVTRSGTNELSGSAYYFTRNENLTGKTIEEPRQKQAPFTDSQYGFRLGGPIIKNKLFFFANVELQRSENPFTINLVDSTTLNAFGGDIPATVSQISTEEAEQVRQHLINNYNYDPGSYGQVTPKSENNKLFGKIDWNINKDHQLSIRHNYIKATDDNISRSQRSLQFTNNGFTFDYESNSTILEVRSRFGNNVSNNLIVGWSTYNQFRDQGGRGPLFPQVEIDTDNGTTITAGSQRSSVGNELDQSVGQLTNNFTIFKNKHVITIGTHNEFFKVRNSFVNRYNGHYEYDGLQNFLNDSTIGSNGRFRVAYSLDYFNDRFQAVELSFLQSALYVQDEWEAAPGLKLTIGLRADMPFFLDEPNYNQSFDNAFGLDTRDLPSGNILWSPRVGFNYDVKGDQSLQLRGGAGIFTGRIPFVWVANNYTNSGASLGLLSIRGSSGSVPLAPDGNRTLEYYFANQLNVDVDDPAVTSAIQTLISGDAGASEINVMDEDFKFPQVFRANLAVDTKLPSGFYGTFEALFSKAVNEIQYQNINLTDPDGNLAFEDNRPTHSSDLENGNFDNVLLITNTQKGYQFSLTGQVQKNWNNNLNSSFAYTYGVSRDVNGGTHTTALSGWEFNPTPGFSNNANVSWSVWDLRHRLMGNINYTHEWLDFTSTSIGLFYSGQSGAPFSYMVNGDLNGDGAFGNDQVYIPRDASEIILESSGSSDTRTEAQIWEELDAFIERDDYLSENRGKIAERNGARTPWTHLFDLRLMQEFKTNFGNKPNRIQLTLDIENVGNFLNKDWGRFNDVRFDSYNLLRFRRVDAATGKAVYQYSDQENAWTVDNDQSIWRMQFGVRYIFN